LPNLANSARGESGRQVSRRSTFTLPGFTRLWITARFCRRHSGFLQ